MVASAMEGERGGRAGAWLWVCCVQFFAMEQVVRAAWQLPYSFRTNYISDLGAMSCGLEVCSPLHGWMNASFLLQGVLIAVGALRLWEALGRERLSRVAMALLMVSGVGLMVGGGTGCLLLGVAMARSWAVTGWISAAIGSAVLVATVLLGMRGTAVWAHLEVGTVERVAGYGLPAWFVGMGVWVLRRSRLA